MTGTAQSSAPSFDDLLRRIRGEFLEMPGLRLTPEQARRLWALDDLTCTKILGALLEREFLVRHSDGRYMRPSEARAESLRTADAKIASEVTSAACANP